MNIVLILFGLSMLECLEVLKNAGTRTDFAVYRF